MGASDYMVGNAPAGASYMAPQVGAQIGQMLEKYPQDYLQGQQMQRQMAVMNAFPNGIPRDANGGPDLNAIMTTLGKAGGGQYIQQLMPFLIQQEVGRQAGQALGNADTQVNGGAQAPPGANTGSGTSNVATGPANLSPRPQASQQPPAQPAEGNQPLSSTGMDNNGADTVRSIIASNAGGRDVSSQISSVARTLRLNPDAPLTPEQATRVRNFKANAAGLSDDSGQPPAQAAQAGTQPQPTGRNDESSLGSESDLRQRMDNLNNVASRLETYGASTAAVNPATSTAALAKAKALREQASQIFEYISKGDQAAYEHQLHNQDLTPEEKIARANNQPTPLANDLAKAKQEADLKRSTAMYNGSNARSTQYDQTLKPMLTTTKALLNRPEMYTGFGGDKLLEVNKVRALLGNQNAAVLQEAMGKITAQSVLSTINEQRDEMMEAGGASARIFSQQVDQVAKAAPQMSNTLAGNRFLVNVAMRMGEISQKVSQMQRDYLKTHPMLDTGFDQQLSDYFQKNPVFSDVELRDPRVLGAPDVPTNIKTQQQLMIWERRMGLHAGDFFRTPDGVKQIPQATTAKPVQAVTP